MVGRSHVWEKVDTVGVWFLQRIELEPLTLGFLETKRRNCVMLMCVVRVQGHYGCRLLLVRSDSQIRRSVSEDMNGQIGGRVWYAGTQASRSV